jgi:hypothetical protein
VIKKDFVYADASARRLISDLSVFTRKKSPLNVLVAATSISFTGRASTAMPTGPDGTIRCSAGWRHWALGLSARKPQMAGEPSRGLTSYYAEQQCSNFYARHQTPTTCPATRFRVRIGALR